MLVLLDGERIRIRISDKLIRIREDQKLTDPEYFLRRSILKYRHERNILWQVPREEEPKLLTLDEWKAMQTKKEPKFNLRKAGEG